MATIHTFVADIVDRIPAMAKDGPDNNRMLLENLTREFLNSIKTDWRRDIELRLAQEIADRKPEPLF
jgi:hypothetical protein